MKLITNSSRLYRSKNIFYVAAFIFLIFLIISRISHHPTPVKVTDRSQLLQENLSDANSLIENAFQLMNYSKVESAAYSKTAKIKESVSSRREQLDQLFKDSGDLLFKYFPAESHDNFDMNQFHAAGDYETNFWFVREFALKLIKNTDCSKSVSKECGKESPLSLAKADYATVLADEADLYRPEPQYFGFLYRKAVIAISSALDVGVQSGWSQERATNYLESNLLRDGRETTAIIENLREHPGARAEEWFTLKKIFELRIRTRKFFKGRLDEDAFSKEVFSAQSLDQIETLLDSK